MKLWLFDILACPIDKFFPLNLKIFSYESGEESLQNHYQIYQKRSLEEIRALNLFRITEKDNQNYISDDIFIQEAPLNEYLKLIIESINELEYITDKTEFEISKTVLKLLRTEIKEKIKLFQANPDPGNLEEIFPELFLLNKIKIELEIDTGLLFCEKCKRWFPIVDSIPQMLPDEHRKEDQETKFLQTNKHLLDEEFLNQDLKPFNVSNKH